MPVNARLKATKIIGQMKAFSRQRIPEKTEMEPVEPIQINIYKSNTFRKDLNWPHFDDEPRVQDKQQRKDQQSCIFVFVACLTFASSN